MAVRIKFDGFRGMLDKAGEKAWLPSKTGREMTASPTPQKGGREPRREDGSSTASSSA